MMKIWLAIASCWSFCTATPTLCTSLPTTARITAVLTRMRSVSPCSKISNESVKIRETLHFAMRDFKDESFISQFLSPKLMRDFRLFTVLDDDRNNYLEIDAIHNEEGYRRIREQLSAQYNLSNHEPNIQVWNVALRGDRSLTLRYVPHNRAPLDKGRREVLKHLHRLWGFDVYLEQVNEEGNVELLERCPSRPNPL